MTHRVGIVGAGVFGRLLAWTLCRSGWKVTLFDKMGSEGKGTCSWVGAGMLAPYAELDVAEMQVADWGIQALDIWPTILQALPYPVYFQREGSLVVAHRQDRAELARFERRLHAKKPGQALYEVVDAQRLALLEPDLERRFGRALFFPTEGQIEPRNLLDALFNDLKDMGAHLRFDVHVDAVLPNEIRIGSESHTFDWVVDARGMGAKQDQADLRGVRGEIIRLHAPEVQLRRPIRLMHPRYPLYIVPRPSQQFLVGATSIESDSQEPMTVRSALELLSAAFSVHSGFAEATILEMQIQVRPAFPANLPQIRNRAGLIQVNGLYRHGFLLAPFLVQEVARFMETGLQTTSHSLWEEVAYASGHR